MKTKQKKKAAAPAYYTIGARFIYGNNLAKVYTYRVRSRHKVHLGQELVADTSYGSALLVVVRIDKVRQDTNPGITYKYVDHKVVPL